MKPRLAANPLMPALVRFLPVLAVSLWALAPGAAPASPVGGETSPAARASSLLSRPAADESARPETAAGPLQGARLRGALPADPTVEAAPALPESIEEAKILGRELKRNGSEGSLVIAPGADGVVARVTFLGRSISDPAEVCAIRMGEARRVPLAPLGRPEGRLRFRLEAPVCPVTFDLLDGAVLADARSVCTFAAADCRVDPTGLWGPSPLALMDEADRSDAIRDAARAALEDAYAALADGLPSAEQHAVAVEQAGFLAEVETLCRDYEAEEAHGFCRTRLTQARIAALAERLANGRP